MTKILIIEDDYNLRTSIRDLLEEAGYTVFMACDGKEGLQLLNEFTPSLIICDVMMPRLDGYELLRQLNNEFGDAHIPFIYLTARADLQDMRQGMELGADDYLTKPFKSAELLKAIEVRIKKNQLRMKSTSLTNKYEEDEKGRLKPEDSIFIDVNNKPRLIFIKDIISISALSEYSILNMKNGDRISIRKSLSNWENTLPLSSFIRIHRSTIININYIDKIDRWFKKSFKVTLKNLKEHYIISQRYAARLKNTHFIK